MINKHISLNKKYHYLYHYSFKFKVIGASDDPCSQTYAGPFAESDPEIHQLTSYINNSIPEGTIKIYISLHSYGQYLLSPWGHTADEFPEHYPQMMGVAKGFADALVRRYGTIFTYGSSATTLCKFYQNYSDSMSCVLIGYMYVFRCRFRFWKRMGLWCKEHYYTLYHRTQR